MQLQGFISIVYSGKAVPTDRMYSVIQSHWISHSRSKFIWYRHILLSIEKSPGNRLRTKERGNLEQLQRRWMRHAQPAKGHGPCRRQRPLVAHRPVLATLRIDR